MAARPIRWLERPGDDFPYYDGQPVWLTLMQWVVILGAVAIAYLVLLFGPAVFGGWAARLVTAILYAAIPLFALAVASRGHWTALFRRVGWRDVRLMVLFAALNLAITLVTGSVLLRVTETTANRSMASAGAQSAAGLVLLYGRAVPQLLGEELMTILPFLAVLYLLAARLKTPRTAAIILAWLLTAVLFAAEHLSTYGWNWVQVLGGVGVARLVLTLPYIRTKNLWVSTGAHVLNDWAMFTLSVLSASFSGSAAPGV